MRLCFANFNVSDANPYGAEGFWLQLALSNAPSRLRLSGRKRAPNRKQARRTLPPCHSVSQFEVGALREHKDLCSNRAMASALCKLKHF